MNSKKIVRSAPKWLAAGIGMAAASYVAYVVVTWFRFGNPKEVGNESTHEALDIFMPIYNVADRHRISVDAPADVTFSAGTEMGFEQSAVVRGIFKARELILGTKPEDAVRPRGIVAETKSLGWGVLAELPGREIVMGAVTKPWEPNPVFRALPSDEFAAFEEPGYVKIAWTLRADSDGKNKSVFRTETRAIATDTQARKKFRWYWSFLSPGIIVIRKAMLPIVKAQAEQRWQRQTVA